MLLIAGGSEDQQISHLFACAQRRGIPALHLQTDMHVNDLNWSLPGGELMMGDRPVNATAAFVRQDVFRQQRTGLEADQLAARAWKIMLDGWLWSQPDIRIFNRDFLMRSEVNKPLALVWANEAGLAIPDTRMHASKARAQAQLDAGPTIYKPIGGGDLCRPLEQSALDAFTTDPLPRPFLYQQTLISPEMRIFRVGERFFAFDVASPELDYRAEGGAPKLTPVEPPPELIAPLTTLLDRLGLKYSAADFKTCPNRGQLCFLEANSNPMFQAFDLAADFALCNAMVDWLVGQTD